MTEAARATAGEVGLLLPRDWWTIRLADADARRRSIAQLVEQQAGRSDQKATLRAELRRELEQTAEQAAAAGGVLLAISTMTVGDLPVPASLTVYRVARRALTDADARELAALLTAELDEPASENAAEPAAQPAAVPSEGGDPAAAPPDDPAAARAEVQVRAGRHGPVVRRLRIGRGGAELGGEDQPVLTVDYWLDAGDGTLTNLTFSSPLVVLAAPLLDLFETVVATLGVEEADAPDDAPPDGPADGAPVP